jgi:lipoprotein-releasing system ATP-binding protein
VQGDQLIVLRCEQIEKRVHVGNGEQIILQPQTHVFEQGKMYLVHGASGAGKTTFLHILAGLEKPSAGKLFFHDKELYAWSKDGLAWYRQKVVGMLFQFHYLIPELSVAENIAVSAHIVGTPHVEIEKKVSELLAFVGLAHKKNASPTHLSGGERQRVALARALMNNPQIILADEPTGSLDKQNAELVRDLFVQVRQKYNSCVIIATHDAELFANTESYPIHIKS